MDLSQSRLLDAAYSIATITTSITNLENELKDLKLPAGHDRIDPLSSHHIAEDMLLSKDSGKIIAETLEIPEMAVEIERAVAQIQKILKAEELERENKLPRTAEKETGSKR